MHSQRSPTTWRQAWQAASFADGGFYRQDSGRPVRHFRTSAHVGGPFIHAISDRVRRLDRRLGHPPRFQIVDVGAGCGELITALRAHLKLADPGVLARSDFVACDVRPRPVDLCPDIGWIDGRAPDAVPDSIVGVVIATELLDDVPLDIAQRDEESLWRYVLVNDSACESLGASVEGEDMRWIQTWTPTDLGRTEVGLPRDRLALALASRVTAGAALFVDYVDDYLPSVAGADRTTSTKRSSTLQAFRDGREHVPVPTSELNLTAAVFLPSVVAALESVGSVVVEYQHQALRGFQKPEHGAAASDQVMARMQWRSQHAELTDVHSSGLGNQRWITMERTL